jgi:hypothetical protein
MTVREHGSYFDEATESRVNALTAPGFTTEAETRSAARVLAGNARDAAELRDWLEICGMRPYAGRGALTATGRPARKHRTEQREAAS